MKQMSSDILSMTPNNISAISIIFCAPGTISIISNAWGGKTSDKYITENCGFLDHILPGDLVMADRGFDIKETLGTKHCQLAMPV